MSYQVTAQKLDEAGFDQSKFSFDYQLVLFWTVCQPEPIARCNVQNNCNHLRLLCYFSVSLEDAHRYNDLTLFDKFKKTTIILGVLTIAKSNIETFDVVRERVMSVLRHIPAERLILAPDCGLGFLPKDILKQKVKNMVTVAQSL